MRNPFVVVVLFCFPLPDFFSCLLFVGWLVGFLFFHEGPGFADVQYEIKAYSLPLIHAAFYLWLGRDSWCQRHREPLRLTGDLTSGLM